MGPPLSCMRAPLYYSILFMPVVWHTIVYKAYQVLYIKLILFTHQVSGSLLSLFTHKGMSSIESHPTSSRKHSLGEKSLPTIKRVRYADTEERSSDLSDTDEEQSELSESSKAGDSDYVQSDNTSTSSVLRSNDLVTIVKDVHLITTIVWPWTRNISSQCSYNSWPQADYNPTDALFAPVSFAASPELLAQTDHPLLQLLQPNVVNSSLFKNRIKDYKEYKGRRNQWHNGNGKGYFTALFKLLLHDVVDCPSDYLM